MNAKLHQNIVVDQNGKSVYIYKPDGTGTTSKVPAALKTAWPAVTTTFWATRASVPAYRRAN